MEQPHRGTESHPDREDARGAGGLSWLVWVAFAFAAYLLAMGPAVKLHRAVPQSRPLITAIYFWVDPLARVSPQFETACRWYVYKVWRVK